MGTFTPIAMKCTQEQFEAIKPKLKGCTIRMITNFNEMPYLINNRCLKQNNITNYLPIEKSLYNRTVHEEWNEEIFLKACGIEVYSLEQQLQKAEAEVKRLKDLIEEENKIKIGDWYLEKNNNNCIRKATSAMSENYLANKNYCKKITDQELIKLLEQEIK